MHYCCHHPEDDHISARNMSMTTTQYTYIHTIQVHLLVCRHIYASNLLFSFSRSVFFRFNLFGITALRFKTPSLNVEGEQ